jgi:CHAT domain-containing protein/predicted negative regulator of RcsB-dependent stress response
MSAERRWLIRHTVGVLSVVSAVASAQNPPAAPPDRDVSRAASPSPKSNFPQKSAIARLYADDVDALNDLVYQGKRLFLTDVVRRSSLGCVQYCAVAVHKAVEGRLREAIRNGNKALHLAVEEKEDLLLALSKRDLASAYNIAGKDDIALRLANEAMEHQRRTFTDRQGILAPLHSIRGDIYLRKGDAKRALDEYGEALGLAFRMGRPFVWQGMLSAYIESGDLESARRVAQDLLDEEPPAFKRSALIGFGEIELRRGNSDLALKRFTESLATPGGSSSFQALWAHEGMGKAYLRKRDIANATKSYLEAADSADSIRLRFTGQEFRAGVFGQLHRIFGQAVSLLMDSGRVDEAWAVSERGRARVLLDLMKAGVSSSESTAVIADAVGKTRPLPEIQAALRPDEAIVQFHVLDDRLYTWMIRKNGISSFKIDIGKRDLHARTTEFRKSIAERREGVEKLAQSLYDTLVKPLNLTAQTRLVLVTHDVLHFLPFQALHSGSGYLIETHPISYAPSASAHVDLLSRPAIGKGRLLAIGNPDLEDPGLELPGAEREVRSIEKLFLGGMVLTRAQATKVAFLENAAKSDVLHIAAHSVVDAVDPMYSRILLSGQDALAGELEAHEIYRLNLRNTRLVTLSACETGLGGVTGGDEIWGFPRAFLGAGARALIVSLWPVADESTQKLMEQLYSRSAKTDLRSALREAQLAVKAEPRYAHPFFWAPFNLIGDPR